MSAPRPTASDSSASASADLPIPASPPISTSPPPPASAPPAERLAYWQAQQQEAKDWSEAFGLRAACATNESARQRDLQDQKDWREHQARATKEVRRIRDALSKATKRWQH